MRTIPTQLYKQAEGQIWPVGHCLPTSDLDVRGKAPHFQKPQSTIVQNITKETIKDEHLKFCLHLAPRRNALS